VIDWSRKGRDSKVFGHNLSWDSKINSRSSWIRGFLDGTDPGEEFGKNSNIKVNLPPGDQVQSKSNGKGWNN
jgi:hypothetical protein